MTVLHWSRFNTGRVSPADAFEAFSAQLFERWIARALGKDLRSYVLRGAGGDGGVEAFVTLANGEVYGLQAKWFPSNLDDSHIRQIRGSVETATRTFPGLRRYIVAIPHNLTNGTPGKTNKPRRGGVERWKELMDALEASHPAVEIVRWDEAGLLDQLAQPGNQEIKALWFEGELTHATLENAWKKTRARLRARYLPSLHARGRIDEIINEDSWPHAQVVRARDTLTQALASLEVIRLDLEAFQRLTLDHLPSGLHGALAMMAGFIGSLRTCAESLRSAIDTGPTLAIERHPAEDAVEEFDKELSHYTHSNTAAYAANHAARALSLMRNCLGDIYRIGAWVRESAVPRIIQGPAGCGKTHALSSIVEGLVNRGAPALLIPAKDHDPHLGAQAVMSQALDVPGWPLRRILDGLQALATLEQIRRAKSGCVDEGFCRCLVVIDGLEESSSNAQRWADIISDIAVEIKDLRRVHVVASARPEYICRQQWPGIVNITSVAEGNVDLRALFRAYAEHYHVQVDPVPWLGWAMRSPLEIRLFAEEFSDRIVSAAEGAKANLLTLFRCKIGRIEAEARDRAGTQVWSEHLDLALKVLEQMTEIGSMGPADGIADTEIVSAVCELDREFTAKHVRDVLQLLLEHGLVDRGFTPAQGLGSPQPIYTLATRHVSDYVLASTLAHRTLAEIGRTEQLQFPDILRQRDSATILYGALLAEQGRFLIDLNWSNAPADLDLRLLHAATLALLPPESAGHRASEIEGWLVETTALNRGLLARLVVPIARVPEHRLGPRLLDRALRTRPLAKRDPIWSVPEDLGGMGPWAGRHNPILDVIHLSDEVDSWDSLPLVVAWTCSSVVESRRRRAREMLARWGGSRLADMVKLVEHMADIDDPQVLDDILVAALGAAVISSIADPALGELARLVDRLFFAENAAAPTTSIPIRVAARAIIERAALLFPGGFDAELQRARPPYAAQGGWPTLDVDELNTTTRSILDYDLDRYVADRCFSNFSKPAPRRRGYDGGHPQAQVDPSLMDALERGVLDGPESLIEMARQAHIEREAWLERERNSSDVALQAISERIAASASRGDGRDPTEITDDVEALRQLRELLQDRVEKPNRSPEFQALLDHAAEVSGTANPRPNQVRNAMIARLVLDWGWSFQEFRHYKRDAPPTVVDDAIALRHGAHAWHGDRSEIATFNEKYVCAAVDRVAGALADRLPVWSESTCTWQRLESLESVGNGIPDPMPRSTDEDNREMAWAGAWDPGANILTVQFADEPDLMVRAERWLTEGDLPDPTTLVRTHAEHWNDAHVLRLKHFRLGHQYCIDQLVEVVAFAIDLRDLVYIRRDAHHLGHAFRDNLAFLDGGVYGSPAIACWAPWLTWQNQEGGYNSFDQDGEAHPVRVHNLVGTFTARHEGQSPAESDVWMPSPGLRTSLGIVGMRGGRWFRTYLDRGGHALAIERDAPSEEYGSIHHYLVTNRAVVMTHLDSEGLRPGWFVRVYREVTPALFMSEAHDVNPQPSQVYRSRDTTWLLIDRVDGEALEAIQLGDELESFREIKAHAADH